MVDRLVFVQEVQQDIDEAYAWYEKQRLGLGEDFLSCVDACIDYIKRTPTHYQIVYKNFRRGLVRRFPYAVFYEYFENSVTVYSIFHNSRDPQKWKERILI